MYAASSIEAALIAYFRFSKQNGLPSDTNVFNMSSPVGCWIFELRFLSLLQTEYVHTKSSFGNCTKSTEKESRLG